MKRLLAVMVVALSFGVAPARADFTLAIGTKWLPVNYSQPVSATDVGVTTPLRGFNYNNLNSYLGFFFLDGRLGFHLALDIGFSQHVDSPASGNDTTLGFTSVGFAVGAKYYLTKPKAQRVSPYVYLDFYKYFALISTSATGLPKGYEGFLAGQLSPLGISAAVGAEYFVTSGFSIGSEVLGLRYGYSNGEYSTGAGVGGTISAVDHVVQFYTGITLNYRFDIAAQVSVRQPPPPSSTEAGSDDSGDDSTPAPAKPKPKRRPPPPPPPTEPPPEAESVD